MAKLKAEVLTRHVMRELWLYSFHGTWRFFQIVGWDLAELDRLGGRWPAPALPRCNPVPEPDKRYDEGAGRLRCYDPSHWQMREIRRPAPPAG